MPNPKPVVDSEDDFELVSVDEELSDDTLERAPERVFSLLRGIAKNPVALAKLVARGYSDEAHAEGWALLHRVTRLPEESNPIVVDSKTADALDALDQWDNENFSVIESALARKFPAQRAALFDKLAAGDGPESVLAVETLLDRLASLSKGKLTDNARADKDADAYLEKRGYTAALRKELREKVTQARALPAFATRDSAAVEERANARREALTALHGWWREWATVARKFVKRRDVLINLGLGQRKKRKATEPPAPT
ncbi:MAG: hypothetical protein U0269_32450 [Polyangiales bacterium]